MVGVLSLTTEFSHSTISCRVHRVHPSRTRPKPRRPRPIDLGVRHCNDNYVTSQTDTSVFAEQVTDSRVLSANAGVAGYQCCASRLHSTLSLETVCLKNQGVANARTGRFRPSLHNREKVRTWKFLRSSSQFGDSLFEHTQTGLETRQIEVQAICLNAFSTP